jgi:hypothetical protein
VLKQDVSLFSDAYSCVKELDIEYKEAVLEDNLCIAGAVEKLSASLRISAEKPRIRSVSAVLAPFIGAVNVFNIGGTLTAEGVVTVPVVYLDENEKLVTEIAEIPYNFTIDKDFKCSKNLTAHAVVTEVFARARHNDEIELNGQLSVEVYASGERSVKYIAKISENGDIIPSDAAISLYIDKKGETLWDVAKALVCREETLLTLNPDLELSLAGGEKVLLYRELF